MERYVVFDIDNTLVHTFPTIDCLYKLIDEDSKEGKNDLNYLTNMMYTFDIPDPLEDGTCDQHCMWGLERPFLPETIGYCIENFTNVYIWTAGRKKYAEKIVEHIFPSFSYNPPIILDGEDTDYDEDRDQVCKPLSKIYDLTDGRANETNTFIVDDRPEVIEFNGDNGILIPSYSFGECDEINVDKILPIINHYVQHDRCLQELTKFFDSSKNVKDVRKLDKSKIFTHCGNENDPIYAQFTSLNPLPTIDKVVDGKVRRRPLSPSYNIHG